MRPQVGTLIAAVLLLMGGCGTGSGPAPSVPKSITVSQVKALSLEESGDMNIRQNLAETPSRPVLGRDLPTTTASR